MKPRQVIFEDRDAELLYRAARAGLRSLDEQEQGRAEIALKRFDNLKRNMQKDEVGLLILVRENAIRHQSLSELRQSLALEN